MGQYKFVAFDLDGTLIPGTSVSAELGRLMGREQELRVLEHRYSCGEISNQEVANLTAKAFEGAHLDIVERYLQACPIVAGLASTLEMLKRQGVRTAVATITWSFAAAFFARKYGIDFHCGTVMSSEGRVLLGNVEKHFDEHDKARFVIDLCSRLEITLDSVVAVGDARSDIPLFRQVGLAIAFNASPAARAAAHFSVCSDNLAGILQFVIPKR
jgi:phosphoserine phosphatase